MPKPEKKFQAGGIEASVFENEIQHEGKFIKIKKVAFQKRYKSANGWQTTYALDLNDLPRAVLCLNKAFEYLVMHSSIDKSDIEEEESAR